MSRKSVLAIVGALLFFAWMGVVAWVVLTTQIPHEDKFDKVIKEVLSEQGADHVDPLLIRAVIWRESKFKPDVLGAAGERGLMQVTEIAADDWIRLAKIPTRADGTYDYEKLYEVKTNIHAGTWYLARALKRWEDRDNPVPFALAEYNAGLTRARRWVDEKQPNSAVAFRENVDFPTTRKYIRTIEEKYEEYKTSDSRPVWMNWWEALQD